MKKAILPCLLCVIFFVVTLGVGQVYAFSPEDMQFNYNGRIFTYSLENNIKTSSQFDLNYEINKYKRFGSRNERIELLKHMVSIGIDKEIALEYIFPNLIETLNKIEKNLHVSAKNASVKINSTGENVFQIKSETIGIDLDRLNLIENIFQNYINQKPLNFSLPIKRTIPKQTKKDFEKFTNLRSDFSTDISSSNEDRKHNIKNALASLNKIEIAPNEIFSFNKIVGRRTAENGYREAKIIVNNEFVDGIGGGVCQVSTTLYNSALLAGLEIVEANKHSKQVSYIKAGFDAMVNFGSSDLKFRNNTS
ncbi:MAG: VanW family protein, partial [Clostridia bacterium]|nr:VanW family protein [Clostridia bacterium]